MPHNPARPLVSKEWGYNWLELIPPEFRTALKYKITRTPGVDNSVDPDEPVGFVITSKVTTDRINEKEKETVELDTVLNLPITTKNHEITKDFGGAEVDVVMIISDDPDDIQVGEGVQWTESYTKTLSTDLGIAFSVGKRLTNAYVDAVVVVDGGSGYSDGTHTGTLTPAAIDPAPTTTATFSFVVTSGVIVSATMTNQGAGYFNRPTVSGLGGGTGANLVAILGGWPELDDKLWDEEMHVDRIIRKRVVDPLYPVDTVTLEDGEVAEMKAIDKWHSWLELSSRTPLAVDEASAIVSYEFRPYKFPGTLDTTTATISDAWLGYRSAKADLVQTTIRTWWEFSDPTPTIAFDEIISDTVVVAGRFIGASRVERFTDVLHNDFSIQMFFGVQVYPATTPSYDEYYLGTPSGSSTAHTSINQQDPGAGGYSVGDVLSLVGSGGTAQIQLTAIQASGYIWSWIVIDDGLGGIYTNPVAASGGTGSGATFNVVTYETADYTPGTAWVGTERIIAASVTPQKEKNLWKIQTYSIVMR